MPTTSGDFSPISELKRYLRLKYVIYYSVFGFLSSLPLLTPATTAVLLSQKEDDRGPLSIHSILSATHLQYMDPHSFGLLGPELVSDPDPGS
jgi:hypothetical protein